MKFNYCFLAALIGVSVAVVQPGFQALSQEGAGNLTQLQRSKKLANLENQSF